MPREGGGVRFVKKCGLSEIAEIEGFLVLENVEVVLILVLKNDGVSYMNSGIFPLCNPIY